MQATQHTNATIIHLKKAWRLESVNKYRDFVKITREAIIIKEVKTQKSVSIRPPYVEHGCRNRTSDYQGQTRIQWSKIKPHRSSTLPAMSLWRSQYWPSQCTKLASLECSCIVDLDDISRVTTNSVLQACPTCRPIDRRKFFLAYKEVDS